MEFLYVLTIVFVVFGLSFLLINIKSVFGKGGFRGTCAQNNAMLKNKIGECSVCGKSADEVCKMPELEKQT
jgi:hypothetical protein